MKKERRVINIDKDNFDFIKKYCEEKSLKMSEWITKKIIEIINKEKNEK
jgi:hypothetical protein